VKIAGLRKAPENFLSAAHIKEMMGGKILAERRGFLADTFKAALVGAASTAGVVHAQSATEGDANILTLPAHSTDLGRPVASHGEGGYGSPSQYERNVQRRQSPGLTQTDQASVSFCPLQSLFGIITPSGVHFERHHQGWWDIDPTKHRLMMHGEEGLMKRSLVFSMDELMRLPSVSRIHFIECGANTGMEWGNVAVPTVQYTHGMLSCSEYTGVPLITLLEMCGADIKRGRFVLAEAADGSSMTRTIPMSLIENGEVLVAYGMNGEMLRPENGYPLRLVVPGVQGVSWVKYLRRIKLGEQPFATKDETLHYVDLMPDGQHRQYTSIQEVKSVITSPSGGQVLTGQGYQTITGLAWSGRGKITLVEVSADGGRNWAQSQLQTPVMSKCLTRFSLPWSWTGKSALLQSRAADETGHVQPTNAQLRKVRGTRSIYHNNSIQTWLVNEAGEVANVHLS
jgi:sulfane dehydrogenase subunit SoxC